MNVLAARSRSSDLWNIADDTDHMVDMWYRSPSASIVRQGLWHPMMDIYIRNGEIVAELELPGLKEDDLDISIEQDHLVVEGSRSRSADYRQEDGYYSERTYGEFRRVVHLPVSVDEDNATASFSDGLLTITLPKKIREGQENQARRQMTGTRFWV